MQSPKKIIKNQNEKKSLIISPCEQCFLKENAMSFSVFYNNSSNDN
jgi:hypothetical protein